MAVAWRGRTADTIPETNTYGTTLNAADPSDPSSMASGDVQFHLEVLSGFGSSPQLPTLQALTSGWTQIADSGQTTPASGSQTTRVRLSWALDTATDPSSTTNVDGLNLNGTPTALNFLHRSMRFAVSGADTANPVNASSVMSASSVPVTTAFSMSGLTTTVPNTLVVAIIVSPDDNTVASQAFATGPSSLTERFDGTSVTGGDQGINIVSGAWATAGATGDYTATIAASDTPWGIIIAIQEPASAGRVRGRRLMMLGAG